MDYPLQNFRKSQVKTMGKTPMAGSCRKCSLLARLRAHDALASHAPEGNTTEQRQRIFVGY
jgi:hypothetical protein